MRLTKTKPSVPARGLLGQRHDLGQSGAHAHYISAPRSRAAALTRQNGRLA
jgi:hypothetical protein